MTTASSLPPLSPPADPDGFATADSRASGYDSASAPIHAIFREQARLSPDAVAVIAPEGSLTYRELDETSDALAAQLIHDGVLPDSLVALSLPRSAELIISLLAILKAG